MIKQQFVLNDGNRPELFVVAQQSFKYDAMSIQITKVLDMENVLLGKSEASVPYKWVYEEIDHKGNVSSVIHRVFGNCLINMPILK